MLGRLIMTIVCAKLVGFCWSSSSIHTTTTTKEECPSRRRMDLVQNIDTLTGTTKLLTPFQPFRFRANDYGMTKYRIDALFQNQSVLNIKVANGARPDSVKGGHDVDGAYSFVQSFFVMGKHVHSIDNRRFDLEMLNLYVKKNNSGEPNSPHKIISINILFQTANQPYSRLNPVVSAIKNMLTFDTPWFSLPYDYDPYSLLPRINSFAVYQSNSLPFPYPQNILQQHDHQHNNKDDTNEKNDNNGKTLRCLEEWPTIKIYVSRKPQLISLEDVEVMKKAEKQFDHHPHNKQKRNEPSSDDDDQKEEKVTQIYLTPLEEHTLIRRSVARAARSIMDVKMGPGNQPEPPQYPRDCQFLEVMQHISKKKKKSSATTVSFKKETYYYLFQVFTLIFTVLLY